MERFCLFIASLLVLAAANGQHQGPSKVDIGTTGLMYSTFGAPFAMEGTVGNTEMTRTYKTLSVTDTVQSKFSAIVVDVCQAKGCWMKVQLDNGEEAMVRFKDYGFFVPKDIKGREVVVNGLAFVEAPDLEAQRHYARDAGKSEAEIAAIKVSETSYGFEAEGVFLKQ